MSPLSQQSQLKPSNSIKQFEFIPDWLLSRPDFKEACKAMEQAEKERIPLILEIHHLNRSEEDKKILSDFLASIKFFMDLPPAVILETGNRLIKEKFCQGEKMIVKGGEADSMLIVYKGSAEVVIDGNRVAYKNEGDVIGELSLDYRMLRSADVIAITDLVAFKLMRDDYESAILNIKRKEKQKTIELLKVITLFKTWSNMKLLLLTTLLNSRHFKKDAVIYERHDPSTCLYFVQEGSIDIYAYVPLEHYNKWPISVSQWLIRQVNREYLIKIATVTHHQYFGEYELKDAKFRAMKAVAHTNAICLILNRDHLYENFSSSEIHDIIQQGVVKLPSLQELQDKMMKDLKSRTTSENALLDALKVNFISLEGRDSILDPKIKKLNPWLTGFRKRRTESVEFLKKNIVFENTKNIKVKKVKKSA